MTKSGKLKNFTNGATVIMERTGHNGMYTILLRNPAGEVHDKQRCDDRTDATDYYKAFCKIAPNL